MKDVVDRQKEDIDELRKMLENLQTKASEISENSMENSKNVARVEELLEKEKQSSFKVIEELTNNDSKIERELVNHKDNMNEALTSIVRDLNILKTNL